MTRVQRKHRRAGTCFILGAALGLALVTALPAGEKKRETSGVPSPEFSPGGGVYTNNLQLVLQGAGTLRYTLDGSEPTETSPAYSSPLSITNSVFVRARAFPAGNPPGPVVSATYTLLDADVRDFNSNLPLVLLNSFGTEIVHEKKVPTTARFIDTFKGRAAVTDAADFEGRCLANIRGRASLRYPKNSFTLKLTDDDGDARNVSVLGFAPESDWVLYAPYPDKTLMRDVLAYEISHQMGHWAPRTRFVEVFVSTAGTRVSRRDYLGVYVFEEKIKRSQQRVNIARLGPEDNAEPALTGGYIFKKDHVGFGGQPVGGGDLGGYPVYGTSTSSKPGFPTGPGAFPADPKGFQPSLQPGGRTVTTTSSSSSSSSRNRTTRGVITNHFGFPLRRDSGSASRELAMTEDEDGLLPEEENFKTSHTNEFYFVEPAAEEITAVQKAWLKEHLNQLERALYGPDFADPLKGYRAFLDPDSFIDYHLVVETTKNVDGFRFSVFFHKDRGGRIKLDPIWDWNLSFGNCNGKQGWLPEFWLWPQLDDRECTWFRRLFEDADFSQRYVDRWAQLRTNVLATEKILARVDELAALLDESQARNYERWPILGRPVNPNYFVGSSYAEEMQFLKKFIATRLEWIEKQFAPVPVAVRNGGQMQLTASAGQIYFTLDGTDPRASGGGVSPAAKNYESPLKLANGSRWFARTRVDNRWSGPLVLVGKP